jgi:hypothetical protein
VIVAKRQRRLSSIDEMVLSLYARGLTTGVIAAHFAQIYDAQVSKDTISRITDRVIEEMTAWVNRPLGADSIGCCESWREGIRVARYAPNKMPVEVKRRRPRAARVCRRSTRARSAPTQARKGVTVKGTPMTCKTTVTDSRLRWRAS